VSDHSTSSPAGAGSGPDGGLSEARVGELVQHWHDGWNDGDVETIMAPFADGVVFRSPFVSRLTGDPAKTAVEGRDALRDYVVGALTRTPGIRYTIDATYFGPDGVVLVYRCHLPDGSIKLGADSMVVDAAGQVVEWRSHYTTESMGLNERA
jgi:hypothetical protein